jgi:hypothetical protein
MTFRAVFLSLLSAKRQIRFRLWQSGSEDAKGQRAKLQSIPEMA